MDDADVHRPGYEKAIEVDGPPRALLHLGEPLRSAPLTLGERASTFSAERLTRSLTRQLELLKASVILTPVDNLPLDAGAGDLARKIRGLYGSDKVRTQEEKRLSNIQFAGRDRISHDINDIHREFADRLGAEAASLRLLSGLHAHVTVFMALASIGDSVLVLPEAAGGHYAVKGILERLGLKVIEMAIDGDRLCIDRAGTLELVRQHEPQLALVDRSEGLKFEDFAWLEAFEGIKIFDASQYLPGIMDGRYANPFDWGFDLQVFSLHKSFPGPQKAGAAARRADGEVWKAYLAGVSAYVSSSHVENSYAAGYALADWRRFARYSDLLAPTAVELETALAARGLPVFPRAAQGLPHWPATHHIWLQCKDQDSAFSAWRALAKVRIQTNYRKLPYGLGWGLRLGTTAAVMRGLAPDNVEQLADVIIRALRDSPSPSLRHAVRDLAERMAQRAIVAW